MRRIPIQATTRNVSGKGHMHRLRRAGSIPAILYGLKAESLLLALNEHDFLKSTRKLGDDMVMFNLSIADSPNGTVLAIIRETQRDPVTERILHLDLMRVDVTRPIDVVIPLHSTGTPVGVQEGGILDQVIRQISIRCLPDSVPTHVEMDVNGLAIGDAIHVSDLNLGDNIEVLSSESEVVFHVLPPRKIEDITGSEESEQETDGEKEG